MSNNVYVVTAYRFGDREKHSYVVGVYSSKELAFEAANEEEAHRGGNKYECEIIDYELDIGDAGLCTTNGLTIKRVDR